jgi:hypothetical protein
MNPGEIYLGVLAIACAISAVAMVKRSPDSVIALVFGAFIFALAFSKYVGSC